VRAEPAAARVRAEPVGARGTDSVVCWSPSLGAGATEAPCAGQLPVPAPAGDPHAVLTALQAAGVETPRPAEHEGVLAIDPERAAVESETDAPVCPRRANGELHPALDSR
jgi:hypothetical protein